MKSIIASAFSALIAGASINLAAPVAPASAQVADSVDLSRIHGGYAEEFAGSAPAPSAVSEYSDVDLVS